ncbi:Murein L,D-transpeptidase YcbB/YkuD [Pedobacter westerhofensis]|uniref:Murein L,D-transpeptidase YcbB/YkuD n=1 Tax=Pedobacter westerhofensis TaxID=425512 RepID=A0A521FCV8_9SPHI|nr:L,D-transpeptidase family protein [Pedobacter westerhofensis]SMO94006.1 Murein L,D-transpeptidase YcbB/YkuD [Pedobacter westerhofensis]
MTPDSKKLLSCPAGITVLLFLLTVFLSQCRPKEVKVARDITITPRNAVTRLFVDSLQMEDFISKQGLEDSSANRLRNFYNSRNFQFAWIAEKGLAEQAKVFYELDKNYISGTRDSTDADQALHNQLGLLLSRDTVIRAVSPALIALELSLTQHFFDFITYAYAGKLDPAALQWYIPRKKLDAVALLDSLVAKKGTSIENWEPVNRYYKSLSKELLRWYAIQQKGTWETISSGKVKIYRQGDTGKVIASIRQRLADFGDLPAGDTTTVFDAALNEAVKKAQKQFGRAQTGRIDQNLLNALNVPAEQRIQQMLINLERMKWTPLIPESKVILVNIPEYKLHVFESGKEVLNMGIVVGKAANQTVIFSNELKNIVFSPYWNIPPSIVRTEILPEMRKNRNYLSQKNMEQYGTSEGLPQIRQKPGSSNSLGKVKFLFPNSYNIYLHDTPAKSLFAEEKRAFSHGCIRLAEPKELAEYLLSDRPEWTSEKIGQAMNKKTEVWVNMKQPVPVFITYFTSWVDKDGLLHFRDDLYGHDKAMAAQMFKSAESKK